MLSNEGGFISARRSAIRTAIKFAPWELSHFLVYRLVELGDELVPLLYSGIGGLVYALMVAYILTAIFTRKK